MPILLEDIPSHYGSSFVAIHYAADLYLMERFLKPYYDPSDRPLVMAVGGGRNESLINIAYHEKNFTESAKNPILVGCNISQRTAWEIEKYNEFVAGPDSGDGTNSMVWKQLAYKTTGLSEDGQYNLAYFRAPDIDGNIDAWFRVLSQASYQVCKGGVIFMITTAGDSDAHDEIIEKVCRSNLPTELVHTDITNVTGHSATTHYKCATFVGK
jgi:hypothetical protein